MSEMSLIEQINTIDEVIDYLGVVKRDIETLNKEVEKQLIFLRQRGLRTEIITVVETKMLHVNTELEKIMERMAYGKLYLENEREYIWRSYNEK